MSKRPGGWRSVQVAASLSLCFNLHSSSKAFRSPTRSLASVRPSPGPILSTHNSMASWAWPTPACLQGAPPPPCRACCRRALSPSPCSVSTWAGKQLPSSLSVLPLPKLPKFEGWRLQPHPAQSLPLQLRNSALPSHICFLSTPFFPPCIYLC